MTKLFSFIGRTVFAAMLFASMSVVTDAHAQSYPSKVVRVVVPYPPGGNTDATARGVTQRLSEIWGQQVLIENRPGAGTTIGAEYVARAAPDGSSLLFSDSATYVITPHLYSKPGYNPLVDFAPITVVFRLSPVLGLSSAVPAKDFKEFLAYAKANPGKLSYGSAGNGSYSHVSIEQLKRITSANLVHVPYKGTGPALTDLIGGRLALMMTSYAVLSPHEKAGKLKIIAAATERRMAVRPDLPTVSESGVPGYSVGIWSAMVAPAGTPAPVLDRIHAGMMQVLRDPEFNEKFLKPQGLEPGGKSREELAAILSAEYARWGQLVKESGAKID